MKFLTFALLTIATLSGCAASSDATSESAPSAVSAPVRFKYARDDRRLDGVLTEVTLTASPAHGVNAFDVLVRYTGTDMRTGLSGSTDVLDDYLFCNITNGPADEVARIECSRDNRIADGTLMELLLEERVGGSNKLFGTLRQTYGQGEAAKTTPTDLGELAWTK